MIKKPHIRLVDARLIFGKAKTEGHIWCLYSSRWAHYPIAMSRDRDKVYKKAKQRTDASARAKAVYARRMAEAT